MSSTQQTPVNFSAEMLIDEGNLVPSPHPRPNGHELAELDIALNDETRRFLRGEASVVHFPVEDEDYKARVLECRKLELENQKATLDIFKDSFAFMKNTFGVDEREMIYYKALAKKVLFARPSGVA